MFRRIISIFHILLIYRNLEVKYPDVSNYNPVVQQKIW